MSGTVRSAGGEPLPGAHVVVRDQGRPGGPWERRVAGATTDAAGTFAVELDGRGLRGPLHVAAADRDPEDPSPAAGHELAMAEATLELEALLAEGGAELELRLVPTLAIAGRVLARDGRPFAGSARVRPGYVLAVAARSRGPLDDAAFARQIYTAVDGEGGFRLPGLAPGLYDLFVSLEGRGFFTFPATYERVDNIPAGTGDLVVELEPVLPVRARFRLEAGGRPLERSLVTVVRYDGVRDREPVPAAGTRVVRELASWPDALPLGFLGGHAWRSEQGSAHAGTYAVEGPGLHRLPELGAGWYQLGVQPRGRSSSPGYAAMATELLYLDGAVEVVFEVVETGVLEGVVQGRAGTAELFVELGDERGRALPLRGTRGFGIGVVRAHGLAADGRFRIEDAPAGARTLQVGTRAELAAGAPRARRELVVQPGENEPLQIELDP